MTTGSPGDASGTAPASWGPAWTRNARSLALAWTLPLAALSWWLAWVLASPSPIGSFSDSIDYLVMSDYYYGFFHGEAHGQAVESFRQSRFPPLFPLLLAAAGALPTREFPAFVVTQLLAAGTVLIFVAWYWRETRNSAIASMLGLAGLVAAGQLHLLLNPVSEPLMGLLLGTTLLLSGRVPRRFSSLLLLAALVGLVPMARMAGAALVAAFGCWLLHDRGHSLPRRFAALLIAALPAAAWLHYRSLMPIEESYVDALSLDRVLEAFGGWSGLLIQPLQLLRGIAGLFGPNPGTISISVAGLLALLAAIALPTRLRANRLDAWFTLIYAGLVLWWPYPAETGRLLLVLAPVLILQAWHGAALLAERMRQLLPAARWLPGAAALGFVAACVPAWSTTIHRAMLAIDPALAPYARTPAYFAVDSDSAAAAHAESWARIVGLAAELPGVVPPGDCVYSLFPGMTWFLSGRATRVSEIPREVTDGRAPLSELRACRFVLPVNLRNSRVEVPPLFPLSGLGSAAIPVLHSEFRHEGRRIVAAVLLKLPAQAPAEQPE